MAKLEEIIGEKLFLRLSEEKQKELENKDYEDVSNGVIRILQGEEPIKSSKLDIVRSFINLIGILVIVLLLASFYGVFKWKKKLKANKINLVPNVILIAAINIALPLLVTVFLHNSVEAIMPYIPDFAGLIILLLSVLFITGIVKISLLLIYRKNTENIN